MRWFKPTKAILLVILLVANLVPALRVSAQSNCKKDCGARLAVTLYQRVCDSGGTCYVTLCDRKYRHAGSCLSGFFNDSCEYWFCYTDY